MTRPRGGRRQVPTDRVLQSQCHGEAWRRVTAGESIGEIVAELQRMVAGRAGILVEIAGVSAGSWAARPSALGTELVVAGLLIRAAGPIAPGELERWVEVGWRRAAAPPHTAS